MRKIVGVWVLVVVGACSGRGDVPDGGDVSPADAEEFCFERAFWSCRREQVAGRITDAEFDDCIAPIETMCEGFTWPTGCAPLQYEADACTNLLRTADRLEDSTEMLLAEEPCRFCD